MINVKTSEIHNFRHLFFLEKFLMGHEGFIAGGCFKNIFTSQRINDIDIFFHNQNEFEKAKKYYRDLIKKDPDNWRKSYENKKAWAVYSIKDKIRIELIRSVFGSPHEIIDDFDFSITKFAYYRDYENIDEDDYLAQFKILFQEDYFEHLQMKRLVLDDKIPFPISTFNRSYKYQKYGYSLCKESKIKLLEAIHEIPELNLEELGKSLYDGKD